MVLSIFKFTNIVKIILKSFYLLKKKFSPGFKSKLRKYESDKMFAHANKYCGLSQRTVILEYFNRPF